MLTSFAQAAKLATSEREKAEKAAEPARKAAIKAILAKRNRAFKEAEREKVHWGFFACFRGGEGGPGSFLSERGRCFLRERRGCRCYPSGDCERMWGPNESW
jgi:hypothetical protein